MDEEITRLNYDYAKNNKPIDEYFIEKLASILINELEINSFIDTSFQGKNPINFFLGEYIPKTKTFIIYLKELLRQIFCTILLYFPSDDIDSKFLPSYLADFAISHELRHVSQNRMLTIPALDLTTKIITLGHPDNLNLNKLTQLYRWFKYQRNYYNNPLEQDANYYAITRCNTILNQLEANGISFIRLENYHKCSSLSKLLTQYSDSLSPTESYFKALHLTKNWKQLKSDIPENLPLETRIALGLEISNEELVKLKNEHQTLVRKLF